MPSTPNYIRNRSPQDFLLPENKVNLPKSGRLFHSLRTMAERASRFTFSLHLHCAAAVKVAEKTSFLEGDGAAHAHALYLRDVSLAELAVGIRSIYDHDPKMLGAGCVAELLKDTSLREKVISRALELGRVRDRRHAEECLEFVEDLCREGGQSPSRVNAYSSHFATAVGHCKLLANRVWAHSSVDETETDAQDLYQVVWLSLLGAVQIDLLIGNGALDADAINKLEESAQNLVRTTLSHEPVFTMYPSGLEETLMIYAPWPDRYFLFNPPPCVLPMGVRNYKLSEPRATTLERCRKEQLADSCQTAEIPLIPPTQVPPPQATNS